MTDLQRFERWLRAADLCVTIEPPLLRTDGQWGLFAWTPYAGERIRTIEAHGLTLAAAVAALRAAAADVTKERKGKTNAD